MLTETVASLCALSALSALCGLLLPPKRREQLSLITGLLCAGAIARLVTLWVG